ncbi:hypothetical protein V6N12_030629 [Hibiscus sabdariffa]|uniref:RNase H type-1 domain-containing protein n=1 Tax=Hibiscus sabdariffa TaxID=183260 RepID=A0ABR2A7Z1_9ROSI
MYKVKDKQIKGIRMVIPKDIALLFMLLDAKQPSLLLSIDEFIADPVLVEKRILNVAISITHTIWQPLPVGWLKFNVDGALGAGGTVGGIGGVLRDECGQHLLTFSIRVRSEFFFMVESDWKNVVDWIHSPSSSPILMNGWVAKIVEVIKSNRFRVLFAPRIYNIEADTLAKLGLRSSGIFMCKITDL